MSLSFSKMYTIISPSKTQDFTRTFPKGENLAHLSQYNTETKKLASIMKKFSAKDLEELMHVSPRIATLNFARFQHWTGNYATRKIDKGGVHNFSPALFAFLGDVYRGFELEQYTRSDFRYAERHLGIISGFYGLLTPMSYIRPYRLEMGTKMVFSVGKEKYKNLYDFWREKITAEVNRNLAKEKVLLNLASNEYSQVIDRRSLTGQIVDVEFKIVKNGSARTIAIYAKRARGDMANWIIRNRIDHPDDLKDFRHDSWKFSAKDSVENKKLFLKKI